MIQNMTSILVKIRKVFKEWSVYTSFHGIPRVISGKYIFINILWLAFFLASFGYCTYRLIDVILVYNNYEIQTNIYVSTESEIEFPAVTICNMSPYKIFDDKIREFLASIRSSYNSSMFGLSIKEDSYINLKEIISQLKLENKINFDLGHDLEQDMLFSCYFNDKKCMASDFTRFWSNDYGNCYTFNDGKLFPVLHTKTSGLGYGLQLELLVNKSKFIKT